MSAAQLYLLFKWARRTQRRLDFTNMLAHDIKTPVFVISGYAYSLKEDIDISERNFYIDNIIEEADEINDLVQKMLNFSKLDSYSMKLNKTEFDLFKAVQKTAEKYTLSENKTIALTQSGDNMICADRELMETVIQNLIDNAVKYSLQQSNGTAHKIRAQTDVAALFSQGQKPKSKGKRLGLVDR